MIQIAHVAPDQIPALRQMLKEYFAWAFALSKASAEAPTFFGHDEELDNLPGAFAPPTGRFLVANDNGTLLGAVALKKSHDKTGELKRLYVRPEARGKQIGLQLVERLKEEAKMIGYNEVILDSHMLMTSAHATYRKAGFVDTSAWDDFPQALVPHVVFMKLDLTD